MKNMEIKKYHASLCFLLAIFRVTSLQAYEIQIEEIPFIETESNISLLDNPAPPDEGEALISWLGGVEEIERILIGIPYMNSNQVILTEEYVRNRFNNTICVNSRRDAWHFAPLTTGTIYLRDDSRIDFSMYLSGISIAGHLFALELSDSN